MNTLIDPAPDSEAAVHVVGGGLAGSEAAWQIAEAGVRVVLHEMRPVRGTAAHDVHGRFGVRRRIDEGVHRRGITTGVKI